MTIMKIPAHVLMVLVALAVVHSTELAGAESLNDLKAKRALAQKPADWGQAVTFLLAAHAEDRANKTTNIARYRDIAICLQNTNRPLAAIAWYQAYRSAPGAEAQKVEAAAVQVELLDVDVRAKMGALFSEAVNVAEKQIKESVALNGVKMKTSHNLFSLPVLQAEAGMPNEALATAKRIDALGVKPDNYSVFIDVSLRYRYRHQWLSPRDRFIYAASLAGDAATVADELKKIAGEKQSEEDARDQSIDGYSRHEGWGYLAEVIRFNRAGEGDYRLACAEQLTAEDPMENVDARSGQILRQNAESDIPAALGSLATPIGQAYLKVRAMRPENAKPELSAATRAFAFKQVVQICSFGTFGSQGPEYDRLLIRAVSRFDDASGVLQGQMPWPLVAWALKRRGEAGIGDETIALLAESGMGVNDSIATSHQDAVGDRPLHWAVRWNNLAAVEVLLANKADPTLANQKGRTPLDLATEPYRTVGDQIAIGNEIIKRLQAAMPKR